ncbi:MAG: MATE family efflux transporter [Clostridiales bacterium]|nr:MATE family efflux transporter [Clostridiales bacterium]
MNKDLTVGKPGAVLWRFCLPLFFSVIFQQLYNIADSFVAGKFINNDALAAVGNSYEITLIFLAFGFGCNIGCSVIVAELFGEKSYNRLKTAVYTTFISCGILCAVLMLLGFLFTDGLLSLINTPENIFADSKLYMDIYLLGLPFIFFYNVSNGIFSALGDSRTPSIFLTCSSLANIAVDIFFVAVLHMGVAGVAWATFICQGVSCILAVIFVLKRMKSIETTGKVELFSKYLLGKMAAVAIPTTLQQSFISVGNIIIQSVINSFGSAVIAGYSAAIKLNNMYVSSLTIIANGISNYTAQNIGAGKYHRIKEGFRAGVKMVWIICLPVFILYFFGSRHIIYLFLENPTGQAMDVGVLFLRITTPFYFLISVKLVSDGILRGTQLMKEFMTGTLVDLIMRVILSEILARTFLGATGIWISWPFGWVVATIISTTFYRKINWDVIRQRKL